MKKLIYRLCVGLCICTMLVTPASALSVREALDILEAKYVNEIPAAAYQAKTLEELFPTLGDPYTYYMTAQEYQDFLSGVEDEGAVAGIGAQITYTEDGILILYTLPGGGAESAGIVSGDLITAVDGVGCVPAKEEDRSLLLGAVGTKVTLTVKHENGVTKDYVIDRREVSVPNTLVSARGGVGSIDCNSFGTQTGKYFIDGVKQYDKDVHFWIVDMRGNLGGVSSAAVDALSAFVGQGPLLYFRDRSGNLTCNYSTNSYLTETPAVVLTDDSTASSAEIFAGDIRALRAGISVGGRTYGKGVAQSVFDEEVSPLFHGDALKLTTYRFYLTDGNTTDRIGVIPTLLVPPGYADAVARLLSEKEPSSFSGYLRLVLAGWAFYVDLAKAQSEENAAAFSYLIAALAPDADAALGNGRRWEPVSVSELRARYGSAESDRWFSDLDNCDYADMINTLGAYGLVSGNGDGTFRPNDTMTRAEVCALLAQALNVATSADGFFADVPQKAWYAESVNAMAMLGLVAGVGNGRFAPNDTMTQEQFITVMGRLAAFLNCNLSDYLDHLDRDSLAGDAELASFQSWSRSHVRMLSSCMTDGRNTVSMLFDDVSELSPGAPILRGEAAATMYRILTTLGILVY